VTIGRNVPVWMLLFATVAYAGPITQDPCPGTVVVEEWKKLGNDVLENLLFADGSLWVSDGTVGSVRRFNPDRSEGMGLTGVSSPGGLARDSDGLIYAGVGNSIANAVLKSGAAKVVRFSPTDPDGSAADYASGFNMPNGMTFGPGGDLYISNDFDYGLIRIQPDGTWAELAHVWGTNGLVVDPAGESLYAAITFDQRSPIERIPLGAPAEHETFAELTFGVASLEPAVYTEPDADAPLVGLKGLDDMTRSDGEGWRLYVVANGMGELLEVDPATGDACLVASGLQTPSSVRIAPAGGPFDTSGKTMTFWVVEFSGSIRRIGYSPE